MNRCESKGVNFQIQTQTIANEVKMLIKISKHISIDVWILLKWKEKKHFK